MAITCRDLTGIYPDEEENSSSDKIQDCRNCGAPLDFRFSECKFCTTPLNNRNEQSGITAKEFADGLLRISKILSIN